MIFKTLAGICAVSAVLAPSDTLSDCNILSRLTPAEKAQLVVGWERKYFPPTNNGFAARTAPNEEYGIPSLVLADGTVGVRLSRRGKERATAFPSNPALASSWNQNLSNAVGAAVGHEAYEYDVNVLLAPGMNIIRNPLCGRSFEYYSEDPLLSGKMASAYIKGIQSNGVAASAKHFACNNQETNRTANDVRVSERALREIYLKAFEICVKEAGPWTIMSSYNQINGVPVQENEALLNDILRKEWGFDGLVMTDWSISPHNTAAQLHAGNDLYMPGGQNQTDDILAGLESGKIKMEDLDRACMNVIKLGRKCAIRQKGDAPDLQKGKELSRTAAIEGSVLLKNDGMLPIEGNNKVALFGVRSYDMVVTGSGAGFVVCPEPTQLYEAFSTAGVSLDAELQDLYTKYVAFKSADIKYNEKVKVHIGVPLLPELKISQLLTDRVAERNDYAIITIGRTGEEGKDRRLNGDWYLSETEIGLIRNVCSAFHSRGKKVAVVLNISSVIETESWKNLPDAILNIWLPGQEGGAAAYALMSGKETPSGKLPVSFPVDYSDYSTAFNFPYDNPKKGRNFDYTMYDEGIYVGYRHFCTREKTVSFPFGYGLSYTSFEYSDAKAYVSGDKVVIKCIITNTGSYDGKEVVAAYVSAPKGALDKPAFELKAFGKTGRLAPGESERIVLEIPLGYLASFDAAKGNWATEKGQYKILLGNDVTKLNKTLKVRID